MRPEAPAVGVLGGTFDPIHCGHLAIAQSARTELGLARVLLVPTALPPHKRARELSPVRHRVAMLRLAIDGEPGLELCALELRDDRVSYTIDTLRALRLGPPPLAPVLIVGMDTLSQIESWRESAALLAEFDLAVAEREGAAERLPAGIARRVVAPMAGSGQQAGGGGRIFRLRAAPVPVSSSAIRARVASGASLAGLVPAAVAGYIEQSRLYSREAAH